MRRVIVVPARLQSERLPRKLLLEETGRPLIVHTVEAGLRVPGVDSVVVAADGEEIASAVAAAGHRAVRTDPELPSGTDRVAAAVRELALPADAVVVNVQGDEPEIEPDAIDALFRALEETPDAAVGTLVVAGREAEFEDPNRVKVAVDGGGYALYFSRAPIPYCRASGGEAAANGRPDRFWRHVGVYAFRPAALEDFARAEPTVLECTERLEQLRFLELGHRIRVVEVDEAAPGIDTAADYAAFVQRSS